MKRSSQWDSEEVPPSKHFAGGQEEAGKGKGGGNHTAMAIKILISPREASAILGTGGGVCKEIGAQTGAKLHCSQRHEFYPGTQLQELTIKGPTTQCVGEAVELIMAKLAEETSRIMCDSREMAEGGCSMKFVIPNAAAKAIIGRGGSNIKLIRDSTGMKVHIDENAVGQYPISEQIVNFFGTISGMQNALPNLFEKIEQECAQTEWFANWAYTSNAAEGGKGGKGKGGKGKGDDGKGKGGFSQGAGYVPAGSGYIGDKGGFEKGYDKGGYEKGYDKGGYGEKGAYHGEKGPVGGKGGPKGGPKGGFGGRSAAVSSPETMEMVAEALQALPGDAGNQIISFNINAQLVSAVIGRQGSGIREIAGHTHSKIQIREIEGNPEEQVVIIAGSPVSVISAFCHCLARAGEAGRQGPPPAHGAKGEW